jgi:glutaminyl-peptide cyclotransferase
MMTTFRRSFIACFMFCILILFISFISCCTNNQSEKKTVSAAQSMDAFRIISPEQGFMIPVNDSLTVSLKIRNQKKITPDSVIVFCAGKRIYTSLNVAEEFGIFLPSDLKVGRQSLKVQLYYNSGQKESKAVGLILLSDITPAELKYKVIKKITHDKNAYTQGLVYFNHMLYEGTGRYENSSLRKLDPADGKVLKMYSLESKYFGEGIAILNDEIYQLTYKSGLGFIYNLNDFKLIRRFNLQTYEGWGLTTNGKVLMMSDGSAQIYFLDPEYLTVLNQIHVMNNKGEVNMINELEYVDGYIYANIYGQSIIAKIDEKTGKVKGVLDLYDLYPEGYHDDMDRVLNGIAYVKSTDSYFVTGKLWPVMYEIKIID